MKPTLSLLRSMTVAAQSEELTVADAAAYLSRLRFDARVEHVELRDLLPGRPDRDYRETPATADHGARVSTPLSPYSSGRETS